jgi:outer membrane protein OmpA-like peptidoglycan-associated protein
MHGQNYSSEVTANFGGGVSYLNFNVNQYKWKNPMYYGFNGGFGYTYFFPKSRFGLSIGAEAAIYNNNVLFPEGRRIVYNVPVADGLFYVIENNGGAERFGTWFMNVPLAVRYLAPIGKQSLYFQLGGQAGIPFTQLVDIAYSGNAEFGARFAVAKRISLYIGAYGEYGFNNIKKNQPVAQKNLYAENILLASNAAGKINPVSFGLKIRIGIGFGKERFADDKKNSKKKEIPDNKYWNGDPKKPIKNIYDVNENGVPNELETADEDDMDGDGILNSEDPDIDGDGILNYQDPTPYGAAKKDSDKDKDKNKKPAVVEEINDNNMPYSNPEQVDKMPYSPNKSNIPDNKYHNGDPNKPIANPYDVNGNEIPDYREWGDNDDMDGDGIPNWKDSDIDGDGILNENDKTPYGASSYRGTDCCKDNGKNNGNNGKSIVKPDESDLPADPNNPFGIVKFNTPIIQFGEPSDVVITPYAREQMDELVKYLIQHPKYYVVVVGHTCDLGTKAQNLHVGLTRANNVAAYLVGRGIRQNKIITISKNDLEPRVPNTSETNRRKNRRVEFKIRSVKPQ